MESKRSTKDSHKITKENKRRKGGRKRHTKTIPKQLTQWQ